MFYGSMTKNKLKGSNLTKGLKFLLRRTNKQKLSRSSLILPLLILTKRFIRLDS